MAIDGTGFRRAALVLCALVTIGADYAPDKPVNPLTPAQVDALRVREVVFEPSVPAAASAPKYARRAEEFRRIAKDALIEVLGKQYDPSHGTSRIVLKFKFLEFDAVPPSSVSSSIFGTLSGPDGSFTHFDGVVTNGFFTLVGAPGSARHMSETEQLHDSAYYGGRWIGLFFLKGGTLTRKLYENDAAASRAAAAPVNAGGVPKL